MNEGPVGEERVVLAVILSTSWCLRISPDWISERLSGKFAMSMGTCREMQGIRVMLASGGSSSCSTSGNDPGGG